MSVDKDESLRAGALFQAIAELCAAAELPPSTTAAVLSKALVLVSMNLCHDKEEFLSRMSYVYDFENFHRPDPMEIN